MKFHLYKFVVLDRILSAREYHVFLNGFAHIVVSGFIIYIAFNFLIYPSSDCSSVLFLMICFERLYNYEVSALIVFIRYSYIALYPAKYTNLEMSWLIATLLLQLIWWSASFLFNFQGSGIAFWAFPADPDSAVYERFRVPYFEHKTR